ncbi:hypothetical protein QBC39DRAFT_434844 [Podospora conica]|nr:hypothetical protein QBC39DRAFT_434844 [Schizothecium conicum]
MTRGVTRVLAAVTTGSRPLPGKSFEVNRECLLLLQPRAEGWEVDPTDATKRKFVPDAVTSEDDSDFSLGKSISTSPDSPGGRPLTGKLTTTRPKQTNKKTKTKHEAVEETSGDDSFDDGTTNDDDSLNLADDGTGRDFLHATQLELRASDPWYIDESNVLAYSDDEVKGSPEDDREPGIAHQRLRDAPVEDKSQPTVDTTSPEARASIARFEEGTFQLLVAPASPRSAKRSLDDAVDADRGASDPPSKKRKGDHILPALSTSLTHPLGTSTSSLRSLDDVEMKDADTVPRGSWQMVKWTGAPVTSGGMDEICPVLCPG